MKIAVGVWTGISDGNVVMIAPSESSELSALHTAVIGEFWRQLGGAPISEPTTIVCIEGSTESPNYGRIWEYDEETQSWRDQDDIIGVL